MTTPRVRRTMDAAGQRLLDDADPNIIVRCTRCRRPLHQLKHRQARLGPVCAKKLSAARDN